MRKHQWRAGVLALAVGAAGCGGGGAVGLPGPEQPAPGPVPEGARGVPGFDTRNYPGDAAMAAWRQASPYRWVGYYLPAPCYTGTSWEGKREALRSMGWGIGVLFVGEQDWPAADAAARAEAAEAAEDAPPRCTRENLGLDRGRDDGRAAAAAAAAEGFPAGTTIFLDVERVDSVSTRLAEYVRGWTRGLTADGRYQPALYAHERNADRLLDVMADAGGGGGVDADTPRLWLARPGGFSLRRAPAESGFPEATVWQGLLDTTETWGGTTLQIDANVADSADPSG